SPASPPTSPSQPACPATSGPWSGSEGRATPRRTRLTRSLHRRPPPQPPRCHPRESGGLCFTPGKDNAGSRFRGNDPWQAAKMTTALRFENALRLAERHRRGQHVARIVEFHLEIHGDPVADEQDACADAHVAAGAVLLLLAQVEADLAVMLPPHRQPGIAGIGAH